jgi:hypothetical protein
MARWVNYRLFSGGFERMGNPKFAEPVAGHLIEKNSRRSGPEIEKKTGIFETPAKNSAL